MSALIAECSERTSHGISRATLDYWVRDASIHRGKRMLGATSRQSCTVCSSAVSFDVADPKTRLMMGCCCCRTNVVPCSIVGRPIVLMDLRTCDLEGRSDTQNHGGRGDVNGIVERNSAKCNSKSRSALMDGQGSRCADPSRKVVDIAGQGQKMIVRLGRNRNNNRTEMTTIVRSSRG